MEVKQERTSTPSTLFRAGYHLPFVAVSAMSSQANSIKLALESLKSSLDTKEFADLRKEVEFLISKVDSLPPDKPLDEGSREFIIGQTTALDRAISDRIETYQLFIPETLLNPESLSKVPPEWIHKSTWDKLDKDTQLDLLQACLSELHGIYDSAVYLVIRAVKRVIASFGNIEKEMALKEANRIIKGEKETPNELKKEALLKYLPSLLIREKELNSFKIMSNRESSETLTACFTLIDELVSGSPFAPESSE